MGSDHVKVLSLSASAFCIRVLIALNRKGVQYEYQEEDLQNKSQLLLTSNPIHKKVPVLIHNGNAVCESLIAVEYIDEVWASEGKSFLPDDPFQRAVARFWANFVDTKVYEAVRGIVQSPSGELQEKAINDLKEACITLDTAVRDVADGKPYFGGESIGFVDISLAPFIPWFKALQEIGNFELPNKKECPHLWEWMDRVVECPGVKEAMALEPPHEKLVAYAKHARKLSLGGRWF